MISENLISAIVSGVIISSPTLVMAYMGVNQYWFMVYCFLCVASVIFLAIKYPMLYSAPDEVFNTLFPK